MTDEEILKKAIKKAVKNGYKSVYSIFLEVIPASKEFIENDEHLKFIFSHDFAKAYWGDRLDIFPIKFRVGKTLDKKKWKSEIVPVIMETYKFHLWIMAQQEDRLKYLKKFL